MMLRPQTTRCLCTQNLSNRLYAPRTAPSQHPNALTARTFSATTTRNEAVDLSYDLWEPPAKPSHPRGLGAPIVFIHGLFGSKKNNRSMSKVLARELQRPVYAIVRLIRPLPARVA